MLKAKEIFTDEVQRLIVSAIEEAELNTSGEIRVHIDENCNGDVLDSATSAFFKLGMNKTELRNGVLFYLSINDRKFAVLGDEGINEIVSAEFWEDITSTAISHFKEGDFTQGLSAGILKAGKKLKEFFPYSDYDVNELENEISFGDI